MSKRLTRVVILGIEGIESWILQPASSSGVLATGLDIWFLEKVCFLGALRAALRCDSEGATILDLGKRASFDLRGACWPRGWGRVDSGGSDVFPIFRILLFFYFWVRSFSTLSKFSTERNKSN